MSSSTESQKTSIFSPNELAFLQTQRLCRIATVNMGGQPHVTPVAFRYNADTDTFDIGGHGGFTKRKKWRDAEQNPQVAIVMDEIVSFNPWKVCGIEIRGTVELLPIGGETVVPGADPEMFHITPKHIVSWGLDTEAYSAPHSRAVNS